MNTFVFRDDSNLDRIKAGLFLALKNLDLTKAKQIRTEAISGGSLFSKVIIISSGLDGLRGVPRAKVFTGIATNNTVNRKVVRIK